MATEADSSAATGPVARLKNILLAPSAEWLRIAAEPMPVAKILGWVAVLAILGPLAGMVKSLVFGDLELDMIAFRPASFLATNAAINWALLVLSTLLLAAIANALAPAFGGRKDGVSALKLVGFGLTGWYLSGLANLVPAHAEIPFAIVLALMLIFAVLGLYTFYILFAGLTPVMGARADRRLVYLFALFVASVGLALLSGVIGGWIMGQVSGPLPVGTILVER